MQPYCASMVQIGRLVWVCHSMYDITKSLDWFISADVPLVNLCVHPISLRRSGRMVVEPSQRHASTGSTVKTFLTQDELASEFDYAPSLADISDLDEPDDDNRWKKNLTDPGADPG